MNWNSLKDALNAVTVPSWTVHFVHVFYILKLLCHKVSLAYQLIEPDISLIMFCFFL